MLPTDGRLDRLITRARRRLLAHRRLLAGLLTAVAVAATLRTLAPPPPDTVPLAIAAHDLAAGATIAGDDLTTVEVPRDAVPDGTVGAAAGSVLAAPVRRGEPITDARLVGPALTVAHPGLVAMPVRLADAATATLLAAGDSIDLYAVAASGSATGGGASTGATQVGSDVLVLALPPADEASNADGLSGRVVVVGVPREAVSRLADASVRSFLTFAFVH